MRATTSLIHKTVLKKDITRYAPIWAGYTILLLIGLFGTMQTPATMARDVLFNLNSMAPINLIYAGICGAFLFMDLYNGRLCNALHAFPIRRESWLATHILSGFLFSFVPNLVISILAGFMLREYSYAALIWFGVCTLQFLFFYSSAILCAVCAGNLIGMGTLYGIFHFIAALIGFAVDTLYIPLMHGIELDEEVFYRFFPVNRLIEFNYAKYEVDYQQAEPIGKFNGLIGDEWLYLGLCAAVGIICLLLAWRVYKKRDLENAGELLSVKRLSPIYLVICTLGAGAFMYLLTEAFATGGYVFLFVGIIIGFFAARMLLNKTTKVFTKKAFLGLGVFVLVLISSFVLTWLDPIGITRYVPETDKIEYAAVVGADKAKYYLIADSYLGVAEESPGFRITDPNEITEVQDFHRELIEHRAEGAEWALCRVRVVYGLKNGRTVQRYYLVAPDSQVGKQAKMYSSDIRYVFEVNDPEVLYTAFYSVSISGDKYGYRNFTLTDAAEIRGLIEAMKKDCAAGNLAQNWAYHGTDAKENYYLNFSLSEAGKTLFADAFHSSLRVWEDSTYTAAYLEQMARLHPETEGTVETEDFKDYPAPG